MAVLRRWAPWLPPSTSTVKRSARRPSAGGAAVRISRRRGFPVQTTLRGSNPPAVRSKEVKIRSAKRARARLVMPGSVFCSHRAIGMRIVQAARTTGPAA